MDKPKIMLKKKIISNISLSVDLINFFDDNKISKQTLDDIDLKQFIGPIENSNWIIRNKLLVGQYPYTEITKLIDIGINNFINLQTIDESNSFTKYEPYLNENHMIHRYPIPDRSIVDDNITITYVKEIIDIIKKPNTMVYIHCMGGHGRTGVIVAILLGLIYKMDHHMALKLTRKLHDARWIYNPPIKSNGKKTVSYKYLSPQTAIQIKQVKRILTGINY